MKRRFKIGKLIRDKMPEIMRNLHITVHDRIMEPEEYCEKLKEKLLEESQEVLNAHTPKEVCEELADVLEVLQTIAKIYDLDFQNVQRIADQKRSEKGGFQDRIYSDFVEINEDNPFISYYLSRPEQYPSF